MLTHHEGLWEEDNSAEMKQQQRTLTYAGVSATSRLGTCHLREEYLELCIK